MCSNITLLHVLLHVPTINSAVMPVLLDVSQMPLLSQQPCFSMPQQSKQFGI